MKIKKIVIDMENGEEKDFIPNDGIIMMVGEFEVNGTKERLMIDQMSDDPVIQLNLLKNIIHRTPLKMSAQNNKQEIASENQEEVNG